MQTRDTTKLHHAKHRFYVIAHIVCGMFQSSNMILLKRIQAAVFHVFLFLLVLFWAERTAWAEGGSTIKCPSPDGRFALRFSELKGQGAGNYKVDLIEKTSGEVVVDLENAFDNHLNDTVLVWSADSKRVAYGTRGDKEGETTIYFWNGSVFEQVLLPANVPDPKIHFGKGAGAVKNYGGAVKPLQWLKSGELELSNDLMMLSRVNNRTYTGVVRFTIRFDARHRPSVHQVEKTETRVDG